MKTFNIGYRLTLKIAWAIQKRSYGLDKWKWEDLPNGQYRTREDARKNMRELRGAFPTLDLRLVRRTIIDRITH